MSIKRGALIVLEGVDRSGKSTQCQKLVESLNKTNVPAELIGFPDRNTLIGKVISQYLSDKNYKLHDKSIHLLFSANRWENVDRINNLLRNGITLIIDRYSFSGIAYSAIKDGMDLDWCKTQEIGLPKPDLVCLLTLSEEQMKNRPGFGTERYENYGTQQKVLSIFDRLMDSSWEIIDAGGTIENVHNTLLSKVLHSLENIKDKEISVLDFKKNGMIQNGNGKMKS